MLRGARARRLTLMATVSVGLVLLLGNVSLGGGGTPPPHPLAHTEGFGNVKVLDFKYDQQFFCTDEATDDLDGPAHNGDGLVSAVDPDEFQVPAGAGDIPLPNHSHIIDGDSFNPIWWQTIAVRVFDRRVWPDVNGRCPANPEGGPPCLTSLAPLREGQRRGQAGPDVLTNVWLLDVGE